MLCPITACALLAAYGCSRSPQVQPARTPATPSFEADARLRDLYTREWAWREAQLPDNEDASRPVSAHLPHVDPDSEARRAQYWQQVLKALAAIDPRALSSAERINYEVYRPQIETLLDGQRFRDYEMPANSDSAFWTDLGFTARRPFRSLRDYENWIAQMREVPRYFTEQVGEMRAGLQRGFTPPRASLAGRDATVAAVVQAAPEDTVFYTPFRAGMPGIAPAEQARLRAAARTVIAGSVQPAHAVLLRFLREEYVPGARQSLAARDLPDGAAYYRAKIREYTTRELAPEAIHAHGEAEVARLHARMLESMRASGFHGDFPSFLHMLRTSARFQARSAQELLMRAAWIAKQFDGKAGQFFGRLPRARFAIEPVPADLAPTYTAGRGGPGVYLVNTYDLPSRPLYNLPALTLHESAPGHAFQGALSLEHAGLPEFRRRSYLSAYGEGWALYCEQLGLEMGIYADEYERFGMLGYQIWRAARLVVDTGIHAQGWSRSQAQDYLRTWTALPEREIATEVDRYITWPGQALSYYIGEQTLLEARARAERALGARFNLRAFHDTVLDLGSVPLSVLDARIDAFIAAGGTGPYPASE